MFPYPINDLLNDLTTIIANEISGGESICQKLIKTLEKQLILKTYRLCNNNKRLTSKRLGISRVKLDYKLKEYKE